MMMMMMMIKFVEITLKVRNQLMTFDEGRYFVTGTLPLAWVVRSAWQWQSKQKRRVISQNMLKDTSEPTNQNFTNQTSFSSHEYEWARQDGMTKFYQMKTGHVTTVANCVFSSGFAWHKQRYMHKRWMSCCLEKCVRSTNPPKPGAPQKVLFFVGQRLIPRAIWTAMQFKSSQLQLANSSCLSHVCTPKAWASTLQSSFFTFETFHINNNSHFLVPSLLPCQPK